MLPAAYIRLDALPLTPSGKLDRQALPERIDLKPSSDRPERKWERELRQLWAQALELDEETIGVHDDFQRLGGHSLVWVGLMARIGQTFDIRPSAGNFLAARTIAGQAEILRSILDGGAILPNGGGAGTGILVPLRLPSADAQPPLFLVHPVAGTVSCYLELVRRLDSGIPVYGLQTPGTDDTLAPIADHSLPELAALYLNAVRLVQKTGPYRLAGWSMGGVLAYEMARQLREAKETVGLLCLIESYTPAMLRRIDRIGGHKTENGLAHDFLRDVLGINPPAGRLVRADLGSLLMAAVPERTFGKDDLRHIDRLFSQYCANRRALAAYRPAACDAALTLIRASEYRLADESCGWSGLALGGVASATAPGTHFTILDRPGVDVCADLLARELAKSRNPP